MFTKEQVVELYDRALLYKKDPEDTLCHLSSPEDAESYGSYLNLLISRLGVTSTVCDLGCGTCSPLRCYEGDISQLNYTALDINENMISRAKNRWSQYPNIRFGIYDLESCNLDKNYDIILLQESIAYFEEEDINELIEYYLTKTNKVLSLSLLDGTLPSDIQDELLISQRRPMVTIYYVLANFPYTVVDRALKPNRYRIDIFKNQRYYDLVKGLERRPYLGNSVISG